MKVFNTIQEIRNYVLTQKQAGKSIGFVPTMGALHKGHLSLIETSKSQNDLTICSIFVNPIQFNNPEDLAKYPQTLEADCTMLDGVGCGAVFAPSVQEMYPEPTAIKFNFGNLETVMEGKFRPGHFNGVGIVVSKLFNIVQPDRTYFGQKDLQQTAVIRQLIKDLSFQIELIVCDTLREDGGLAMSSRNKNILPEHKQLATEIFKLLEATMLSVEVDKPIEEIQQFAHKILGYFPEYQLEYFEVVNVNTLMPVTKRQPEGQTAICIAAYLGKVRLIDNLVF
jgi:pantoate--beta-alanine ligase